MLYVGRAVSKCGLLRPIPMRTLSRLPQVAKRNHTTIVGACQGANWRCYNREGQAGQSPL